MTPVVRDLVIRNRLGLHARAAAKLAKVAEAFESRVVVEKDGASADAKSVMGLLLLCGQTGARIRVTAVGNDAEQAVDAIAELVGDSFGEAR